MPEALRSGTRGSFLVLSLFVGSISAPQLEATRNTPVVEQSWSHRLPAGRENMPRGGVGHLRAC